jgi:exo-1,4-beta-D-glucosaminidase
MAGPYGWVPPNSWYTGTNSNSVGTAFGFATEISPGAAPLTSDSMNKTVAADALWEDGPTADWDFHCGASTGAFGSLRHFSPGLAARLGNATSAADYLKKAQLEAYESHRAMFEAYSKNKYNSTGLIQWMLNSACKSLLFSTRNAVLHE